MTIDPVIFTLIAGVLLAIGIILGILLALHARRQVGKEQHEQVYSDEPYAPPAYWGAGE